MDSKKTRFKFHLENKTTRFGNFTWADHPKLREAIQAVRDQMGGHLPTKFKIKL